MYYYRIVLTVLVVTLAVLSQLQVDSDPEVLRSSVVLTGSPTEIYRFVSDMKLYAKWYPSVYSYESLDERAMGVGKQYTQISHIPWVGQRKHTIMVIDYDPPRYLAYIEDSISLPKVEIFLERINSERTRLTWKLSSRWRSYLFKYVVSPVLRLGNDGLTKQAMFNLRAILQI